LGQQIKRGDIVTVAANGHYSGKPRPALVLQSNLFAALGNVTICLLTIGNRIESLDRELLVRVDRSLAVFLGIV
jgi:mRNA-degrading endonuclease toxin of MazEF toxin-antitoxin module